MFLVLCCISLVLKINVGMYIGNISNDNNSLLCCKLIVRVVLNMLIIDKVGVLINSDINNS